MRGYKLDWLRHELLRKTREGCAQGHNWIPKQDLPFTEIVLYAYAADCTPYPTYVLLPTGLHKARTGALVPRQGPQKIIPLPGMYFFDGWRVEPSQKSQTTFRKPKRCQFESQPGRPLREQRLPDKPEDEARDILAAAAKNQVECGPGTRRAAVRAIKYLRTLVNEYGSTIDEIHTQARLHTQKSKGIIEPGKWYQPTGKACHIERGDL